MSPARKRTQADALSLALRAFVDLSEETKTLICDCNADLYGGPSAPTSDNFRGFAAGTRFLTELLDEVRDYWFDTQSEGITDSEPTWCEGCDDPGCDGQQPLDWMHITRDQALSILVGRELAVYVK